MFKWGDILKDRRKEMINDINRGKSNLTPKFLRARSINDLVTNIIQNVSMFTLCSPILLRGMGIRVLNVSNLI